MKISRARRGIALGTLVVLAAGTLGGCVSTVVSGPQPAMRVVSCGPVVEVEIHNTDTVAHRYTVSVTVKHDALEETIQASSEGVAPGAKATVSHELLGGEDASCTIVGAQTHAG